MVWAGINYEYRTQLVVIDGNLNAQNTETVSLLHTLFFSYKSRRYFRIQQDSARSLDARDNIQFLRNNNIDFIDDWPSRSPELNPIEHLWDNLDTRVRQRQNLSGNVNELRNAVLEERHGIHQVQINNLIHSMRRHCQAVSNARGGHTRY